MAANLESERRAATIKSTTSESTIESTKRMFSTVGEFVGNLIPLAIVGCTVVGAVGDGNAVGAPLKSIAIGAALVLQQAQAEKTRRDEVVIEMERISYQSRRVEYMQQYPPDKLNPLVREKALGLLAETLNFFTTAVKYWKHGFFRNVGRALALGPEVWKSTVAALHLAYEEYDQALLLQISGNVLGEIPIGLPVLGSYRLIIITCQICKRRSSAMHQPMTRKLLRSGCRRPRGKSKRSSSQTVARGPKELSLGFSKLKPSEIGA
jgi:hypothetical protein